MDINTGFDSENGVLRIVITTDLLDGYYSNFKGMIMNNKKIPKGVKVNQEDEKTAVIYIPIDNKHIEDENIGSGRAIVCIDKNMLNAVYLSIRSFTGACLRYKLKNTEFLPISGKDYSIDKLKEDVKTAISGKRDFCLIKTYKEFLDNEKNQEYVYTQYPVKYGTDEYFDISILIETGDLKSVQKKYMSLLKKVSWC